jgi:hypothetical protein
MNIPKQRSDQRACFIEAARKTAADESRKRFWEAFQKIIQEKLRTEREITRARRRNRLRKVEI